MPDRPHEGAFLPGEPRLYRALFESAPVAMLVADDARRYVRANDAACRLLGLTRAELLTRRIDDLMPLDAASLDAMWEEFRRVGEQSAEVSLTRPDGTARVVAFSARANVEPGLHFSVLLDVTAQRAADGASARERDRLYTVAQQGRERLLRLQIVTAALAGARTLHDVAQVIVNEGCAAFEAQRGVVTILAEGEAAIEIVAVRGAPGEVATIGQRFPLAEPTPMVDAVHSATLQLFASPAALEARYPVLFRRYWSEYGALVALPLATGSVGIGAVALAYSAPREFSDEDRDALLAFGRLCSQAVERAQLFDLAQSERRRAEEANRVKDEFLAVVSHELRTPLHAMLGWAALARGGRLSVEAQARALETVERNARAQAKLVEDLLDVTRITSGKLKLQVEPVDIVQVVEAALDVVRPAADAKGVRLELRLDEIAGPLVGDPDRLQQIAWNLLSNAVKFTDRGGRVEAALAQDEGAVILTVSDSGQGIDPSFLPHLYERFRQADSSRRGGRGLGLGLAIVRHLVELHGGTIHAHSVGLGHGTRFAVRLPLASGTAPSTVPPSVRPVPSDIGCPPQLVGLRVLVVDDEQESRELLASVLAPCRLVVDLASCTEEALALFAENIPDVIVSDLNMPGEDGFAFIERVRRMPAHLGGATPAVALTAQARWEDRTRALLAGFDMHLSKPVAPAELLVVIANVAGRLVVRRTE